MSFARQLLWSISDQMGRSRKDMDPFIGTLQKNWYDTRDAMKSMTAKDFDRLDFPSRLSGMIMEKLGTYNQSKVSGQMRSEKMEIESHIADYTDKMKKNLSKSDFDEVIRLLSKIFSNIRDNVTQVKYRQLKKSNDKIAKLISIPQVEKILEYGGFERNNQGYTMNKINLSLLDQCILEIGKHGQRITFNPYEQKIISLNKSNIKVEGQTSVVFNEMLAEEKRRREEMMSRPVKDRDIKVFQVKPQKIQRMQLQFNEKQQLNEEQKLYSQSIKQKLKNYGKQAEFMNKRKQEYYDLLKQPLYTETVARVKLPNNYIFECKFSPMETLQTLVDIFHENLQYQKLDYYLYMTPPVQKLRGTILRQTFFDLGCVPRAIFHFKCEDQIKQNIMKAPKKSTGFFSFFN